MHQIFFVLLCSIAVVAGQDPNCTADSSRTARVRKIGETLLGRLGMQEPLPNPTGPVVVPERVMTDFMAINEVDSLRESEVEQNCLERRPRAKDILVFFPSIQTVPFTYDPGESTNNTLLIPVLCSIIEYYYHYGYHNLKVNIPPIQYKLQIPLNLTNVRIVTSAELILLSHVASYRQVLQEIETIQISLIYKKDQDYSKRVKETILTQVLSTDDGYISFNVTEAIKRWLEINQHLNGVGIMELEVAILPPHSLHYIHYPPVLEFDISSESNTQFVVMSAPPEQPPEQMSSRKKRQILNGDFCFGSPNEPNCCIRELTINFEEDLGWTWVLSPLQYQANYCVGLCPVLWPSASFATQIFQLYAENNPGGAVQPCCSTEELSPLTLLILNGNGNTQLIKLSDMVIHSCICR